MKLTRAWIYGGSIYVLAITLLLATPDAVSDLPVQTWAYFASLPFGLITNVLSYFVLIAGWMLFDADPFSMYVVWLVQAAIWMTGAVCNVVLAWLAWSGLKSCCLPRLLSARSRFA